MSALTPPRRRWTVSHPEVALGETIEVATSDEAWRIAWHRWYGRAPRGDLEELLYAALSVEEIRKPGP